jgi:hypothetical protein
VRISVHATGSVGAALWRAACVSSLACALVCSAHAQTPAENKTASAETAADKQQPDLAHYLQTLARLRLLPVESGSVAQLQVLVAEGERLYLAGQDNEAAILLLEAVESPRFADFKSFDEYVAAEHMAGAALLRIGSLNTARRYLQRVIERGPQTAYYGPAVRKYVDVALALGDVQAAADWLAPHEARMTDDAKNELRYLRARARYDAADSAGAAVVFGQIDKRSRFYANAQYFLGAIAAKEKKYKQAERRFCAVADQGADDHYGFYVDDRFFQVQDLARLALGRTAHEMHRGDDAFYYYFQVPHDSPRVQAALFEAAFASYEGHQQDTALDLLDQLQARFPQSPYVDEAAILRGYVALARCDFERADKQFSAFLAHFTPLADEIERIEQNPVRRRDLYQELLRADAGRTPLQAQRRTLLALLAVDPQFYRLHAEVRALDAEVARSGHLADALSAIAVRYSGSEKPRAALAAGSDAVDDSAALDHDLQLGFTLARSLGEQLDAMRAANAPARELTAREQELAALARRLQSVKERALTAKQKHKAKQIAAEPSAGKGMPTGLAPLLTRDVAFARELPSRTTALREKLVRAASARAEFALQALHKRLSGMLRRARIGRIDAVMASKRRLELQIESLAAGRFPAELHDPLLVQGLLNDDEEFWPFQGEDWPDEYEERYTEPGDDAAQAEPSDAKAAVP